MSHLQGTTVALLSSLQEAVAADCWSLQAQGGGSVLQAAGLPGAQVLLVVGAAAAAEGARDVPAGQRDRQTDRLEDGLGPDLLAVRADAMRESLPESAGHDAAFSRADAAAGVVVVHAQVVAHLVGQRGSHSDGLVVVILPE